MFLVCWDRTKNRMVLSCIFLHLNLLGLMRLKQKAIGHLTDWLTYMTSQEIERRRGMMRQRAQERKNEEMEVMEVEDEGRSGEESESESEYEEYTDSEDEMEPRLKPVFIRK